MRFGKFKAMQREQFTTTNTTALWWGTRHFTLTNELIKIINNVIIKFGGFAEIFMDAQTNVNGVTFSVCSGFQSSLLRRLGAVLSTGVEVDIVDADCLLNSLPRWPYVSFEFRTFGFGSFFFVVEGIQLRRRKRLTDRNQQNEKENETRGEIIWRITNKKSPKPAAFVRRIEHGLLFLFGGFFL